MGDFIKGDYKPSTTEQAAEQQVYGFEKYFPRLIQAINAQAVPTAQAQQAARAATLPGEQAMQAQLFQQYSPQYAQTAANTQLGLLQGAGGQSVLANQALERQIDPEYYATRSASANKLMDLINNPISGSEITAIERANNRGAINEGRAGLGTQQQTLSNAINFGAAGRDRLGQALSLATSSLPTYRSGTDTFGQATGVQGTTGNAAANQLQGGNMGQSAYGTGNQFANNLGQYNIAQQQVEGNRRTVGEMGGRAFSELTGGQGIGAFGGCCWIFMEAYEGAMPESVRLCRDWFYQREPRLKQGYKRMANWLVPIMQDIKWVRQLVWKFMVKPITDYGEYLTGSKNTYRWYEKFAKQFWFGLWRIL